MVKPLRKPEMARRIFKQIKDACSFLPEATNFYDRGRNFFFLNQGWEWAMKSKLSSYSTSQSMKNINNLVKENFHGGQWDSSLWVKAFAKLV